MHKIDLIPRHLVSRRVFSRLGLLAVGLGLFSLPLAALNKLGVPTEAESETRPADLPDDVDFIPNLVVGQSNGVVEKLDLYIPKDAKQPMPVVMTVHGGGWYSGDKRQVPLKLALPLFKAGFAIAGVNYRFARVAKFPAQLDDCKAAVRFLRANAAKYHLNPDKIGAWGSSAGAQLVDLLGTTANHPEMEGDEGDLSVSSAVQAVCSRSGASDFISIYSQGKSPNRERMEKQGFAPLLGGPILQNQANARAASAVFFVSPSDPPFLLITGTEDTAIPMEQSVEFYNALKKAGVDATLDIVQGVGHEPKDDATWNKTVQFFEKYLGNS